MIEITSSAINQFKKLAKQENINAFMFSVTGGGCAGFNYSLSSIEEDGIKKEDGVLNLEGIKFVIDSTSLLYLIGTKIDYEKDILGSRFTFSNPQAISECGCGTSFSV